MPDPIHGDCVRLEREGGLAIITLDRPQARNALDLAMGLGLRDAVRELAAAPPRVLVLRSSGAHFMVGGDVRRFDALAVTDRLRALDPTRPIDHASGWHDQGGGDLKSRHVYYRPVRLRVSGQNGQILEARAR